MRVRWEEWKPIADFIHYEISTAGRIRSIRSDPPQILKTFDSNGYRSIILSLNGARKMCRVHRLVAHAFLPKPRAGQIICHRDDNRANNRVINLYWGTHRTNALDRTKNGKGFGAKNGRAKFSETDIKRIRSLRKLGISQEKLAKIFGTTQSQIARIERKEQWKHL